MNGRRLSLRSEITLAAVVFVVAGVSIAVMVTRGKVERAPVRSVAVADRPRVEALRVEPGASTTMRDAAPAPLIAPPPTLSPRASVQPPATKVPTVASKGSNPKEQATPRPVSKKDGPDRPIARQALDLVGADPVAEAIWMQAINDPTISAHDRQDLIEDLNENGFDDPAHPSADDLPIIENRLALIEQLAPDAMDDVNASAFAEAYKDLINMHAKALAD
jgi:hypothetical protein